MEMRDPTKPLPEPQGPRAVGVIQDRVDDWTGILAWRTVPVGHADEAPLEVLSWLLANGRGTRMDDALYYKREIALDDNTFTWFGEREGLFGAYVTLAEPKLDKVEARVLEILADVVDEPPTDAELHRAKQAIRAGMLDAMERPAGRAEALAECFAVHGHVDCRAQRLARIQAVTADDVVRVVEDWIGPNQRYSLSVVPQGSTEALLGAEPVELP